MNDFKLEEIASGMIDAISVGNVPVDSTDMSAKINEDTATFSMTRYHDSEDREPIGQYIYFVTIKAEYKPYWNENATK